MVDKYFRIITGANYCGYDNEYLFCGTCKNALLMADEMADEIAIGVAYEMGEVNEDEEKPMAFADVEEITKEEYDKYLVEDCLEDL